MMPVSETIGTIADFAVEIIKMINPSELERVKKAIRKHEEELAIMEHEHEKRINRLKQAISDGDIDSINAILDE
jgi:hypothetical protein